MVGDGGERVGGDARGDSGSRRVFGGDASVADVVPKSRAEKPEVLEEQAALPEALEGVVGHAVWQPSPQVVPPAAEEDKVEEIEREESQPQAI